MRENAAGQDETRGLEPDQRPIRILVIESDEGICWGLSFLLQNSGIWQIVGEFDRVETGLARLEALSSTSQPVQVLLLGLDAETPDRLMPILQSIRSIVPTLPIVVLGKMPASVKMMGRLAVSGYWWKGDRPEALVKILADLQSNPRFNLRATSGAASGAGPRSDIAVKPSRQVVTPDLAALARLSRTSGIAESWLAVDPRFAIFDRTLANLNWQLRSQPMSWLDRSLTAGRIRELQTARWIAQQILPKQINQPNRTGPSSRPSSIPPSNDRQESPEMPLIVRSTATPDSLSDALSDLGDESSLSSFANLTYPHITRLFDLFTLKLNVLHHPQDGTDSKLSSQLLTALELDILTPDRRYQLLTLTAQILQTELNQMQRQQVRLSQLYTDKTRFLEAIWETTTTQFFASPAVQGANSLQGFGSAQGFNSAKGFNLTPTLLRSRSNVSTAILNPIPLTGEWLAYLLFQTPLTLNNRPYPAESSEAESRALMILENITIQIANAVLQPLINQFSDVESVKERFFNTRYSSSRDLTKFRNNLSWRYRRDRWIDTPTAIFESQYRLLYLTPRGIQSTSIYAPRSAEFQSLAGFPLAVTLALETRDALSPRLRSALSFIGSGVVYVLTEVVGRGIGLIGRGIAKGIGNAWQERR